MPHPIGATDGKHIYIETSNSQEQRFYNYKGYFSMVPVAVCGANYCFTLFDLG